MAPLKGLASVPWRLCGGFPFQRSLWILGVGCLIVLPVLGPDFGARFRAGFGRKHDANGPDSGPKRPGPEVQEMGDRILIPSH